MIEEKTLKFRFPPPKDNDGNINPLVLHIHWMHEVQTAFGEDVIFFDNSNRKIGKLDPLRNKPDSQAYQFMVHNALNSAVKTSESPIKKTHIVIHRIQSKYPLSEIKNAPNVANLMRKYDFYVNDHTWSETEWDTVQLGFFYGLNPQFYDIHQATCKIQEVLKKNAPRMKAPRFRLVFSSPKVRTARGSNRIIRTKAYAIETLRKDRDDMNRILKQAYKDDGTFVPFQMRSRHPEAFEKMIRAQTHLLAHNFVIILNHVGPDVMHYISERILALGGVQAVLPCKSVNEDGRYKVLVNKEQYHEARDRLKEELQSWIEDHAAPDARATLDKYPLPPEVAPINSDGFSQGEQSYMNISINTAFSIGSNISDSSPPTYVFQDTNMPLDDTSTLGGSRDAPLGRARTWADAVTGRSKPAMEIVDVGQVNIDQGTIISDLESSRAEVETLKSKVAQLEAERIEHQKALANTVQDQVSKAVQDQMNLFTAQMTQMFANLVTTLHHVPAAIPKRPAHDMLEDEGDHNQQEETSNNVTSKRRDNKKSPIKQMQSSGIISGPDRNTPDSDTYPRSLSQVENDPQVEVFQFNPNALFSETSAVVNMSHSEERDIIMQDSGIESTKKSLTPPMEAEAHQSRK